MTNIRNALMQAAGSASGDKVYVEDVFSTHLFTGTQSTLAINNGIDLDDKGGLIWFKARDNARNHALFDTERGNNLLYSSTNAAQSATTTAVTATNSNGFTVGSDTQVNKSGETIVAWTFAKQEGFFDVVTYAGNSTSGHNISHSLGSVPKMMIIKSTSHSGEWFVYHESLGATKFLRLHLTHAEEAYTGAFNDTAPTSSVFTVGNDSAINYTGRTYVAYLFGDEASFGEDGDEAIVKTGSYTGTGNTSLSVNLGFEPQWLLIKASSGGNAASQYWAIYDVMRGWTNVTGSTKYLAPNLSSAEATWWDLQPTSTGFASTADSGTRANESGTTYIYMAIRRGPMREPSAGTDVLDIRTSTSAGSPAFLWNSLPFPPDWAGYRAPVDNGYAFQNSARLIQGKSLATRNSDATQTSSNMMFDAQDAWFAWGSSGLTGYYSYAWRRYPKVFDVVAYSPLLSDPVPRNVHNHNLTVKPELIIVKQTTSVYGARNWAVGAPDLLGVTSSDTLGLNLDVAEGGTGTYNLFDSNQPTATQFTVGYNTTGVGVFGESYIAYLFASLDGISKVGTYSGTGSDVNVTGLGAAARFVMIKRTDASGDWFVFDSAMGGIVSGNDQYFRMNVGAAPVTGTDYIDPHSSGFTITSSAPAALNASGGTYLYLAFA